MEQLEQSEQRYEVADLPNAAELAAYGSPESADLSPRTEQQTGYEELSQAYWNQSSGEPLTSDFAWADLSDEDRLPDSDEGFVPSEASNTADEEPSPSRHSWLKRQTGWLPILKRSLCFR